ncbi:hypothetical protein PDE_09253 [Penicillium oxalicum 114-2]|uniref:glutathione transferase n=1 Tax=Penicillium oxalicum (strain 114-2 / CGMCC 5302) TaxID=933388 RepID=S7ZV48_PENO1|nr:hypothetical protein PDE_09253 [Penicillium oxalicum 114-2]
MALKAIKIYDHGPSPNPWKVVILLEELDLPYVREAVDFADAKKEPFISINPNGRLPAIEDPNTGMTLWESGAILEYLVETYDKEHKLSFECGSRDYFLAKQWLHFQMSGQGPYFGQAVWFTKSHPEKLKSASERYIREIRRVSGVLDKFLQDKEYLVGGKFSYVDLAFIPWYLIMSWFDIDLASEFPSLDAWLSRQKVRPAIEKTLKARDAEPFI